MKIEADMIYDANFSIREHRGMGKYINNFVACVRTGKGLKVLGLLKGNSKAPDEKNYYAFGCNNYVFWEQISLLYLPRSFKGITFYPYNTAPLLLRKSSFNVLVLHDLIYMNTYKTKSFVQKIGIIYRRFIVPKIVSKFEHIITVSEHSKAELLKRFNIDPFKITVIPNAIAFSRKDIEGNPSYEERENYILHIGGEPQYKNSKALLYAFAGLPDVIKTKYKLKIIGIRNRETLAEYQRLGSVLNISSRIEFLGYQSNEEISSLYKGAKMFVFPSFYEGFGIPIIESFKYGCPLLCSNSSCFPEIAGDAATYFNPSSPESITEAIVLSLDDREQSESKVVKGYARLEMYSLEVFDKKVLSWYKSKFENKI